MDRIQKLNYEKDFRIAFLEARGDAFQRFFEKLMGKRHPNDFLACRPWGKQGDQKNDGYLPSKRELFQVYGPNEMTNAAAIAKITEDFNGALPHWTAYFDEWVFVHNTHDGRLSPDVIRTLIDLHKANPSITVSHWGYDELLLEFRELDAASLQSWFGIAPSIAELTGLGYADLLAVLTHVATAASPDPSQVKDVARGKIEVNHLSPSVAAFLKLGATKANQVENFFDTWKTPFYGEQIAAAFKARYIELRDQTPSLHPDEIFGQLEAWAGGAINTKPTSKMAVLAVMAYLFDKCEIFEEPPVLQ